MRYLFLFFLLLKGKLFLIGHSLGVAFILSMLEKSTIPVKGCFLVSGFLGNLDISQFDEVNTTFTIQQFDWELILRSCGQVKVYNSDTDPYVPLKKGQELAQLLKAPLIIIRNGGHINTAAGFTEFPELLSDIKQYLLQ